MAKNELSKIEQEKALAEFQQGVATFDGDNSLSLGRAAMCYGTPEEEQMYGAIGAKRGVLIDTMEKRGLASTKIVPLYGWEDRCCWPKGEKAPTYVYKFKDYNKIPAGHSDWSDDGKGGRVPPIASIRYNFVCFVEGEQFPYLFTFKRTSAKAGEFIRTMEARRATRKMGTAMYVLKLIDDKTSEGKAYKRLVAEVVGDCPADMVPMVVTARKQTAVLSAVAEQMSTEHAGEVEEEVPF